MAETNFWQQIWQREKPWNTGAVVGTALQVPGEAMDSLDRAVNIPGTKWSVYDARHSIIDPLVNRANKLDPSGTAGVVTSIATEMLIPDSTLYFGKLIKGASKISRAVKGAGKGSQLAYAVAGAGDASRATGNVKPSNVLQVRGGEGIVKPTKLTDEIRDLLKDVDPDLARRDIAKRYADDPGFMEKLKVLHGNVRKYVDSKGKGRLAGYPKEGRTIKAPDGIEYRVRDSNKAGGKGKFSINQDISARNTDQIRKIARQSDEGSLLQHFKKYVPKNKTKEALESYKATSQKIYKSLESARSRYNIKLKKAGVPKSEHATVEHIFDVDFYKRLKDEVPGFSGQGADEAWNLKMISFALNSKTGALNKKVKDIGQTLIDSVKKDEFIDYNKVVKDFVQNDLGTKVNKLKPKDWDKITDFSMKNPDLNMHQILLEYTKNL